MGKSTRTNFAVILSVLLLLVTGMKISPSKRKGYVNINYTESFEDEASLKSVKKWVANADVDETREISTEKSTDGSSSLKITVKFNTRRYYYLNIPLRVPAEGSCFLRMDFYIDKSSTAQFFPGLRMSLPLTSASGMVVKYDKISKGKWNNLWMDIVEEGESSANSYLRERNIPGITPKIVGKQVDGIGLMFLGSPGQHITVYIDKVQVSGVVPSIDHYQEMLEKRKIFGDAAVTKIVNNWQNDIKQAKNKLIKTSATSAPAKSYKKDILEFIKETEKHIAVMLEKKKLSNKNDIAKIKYFQNTFVKNIKYLNTKTSREKLRVYIINPMLPFKIIPNTKIVGGKISTELFANITPNEFEPLSFVLNSDTDIKNIKLTMSDLKSNENTLKSKNVDLKVVKVWYQVPSPESAPVSARHRGAALTPELLLNNDNLIKVNTKTKDNYALLNGRYKLISQRKLLKKTILGDSLENFPIRDGSKLQTFNLIKNQNKQIWLTVHVPSNTKAGTYVGKLKISSPSGLNKSIKVKIKVLPFTLEDKGITSSIYYRSFIQNNNVGSIGSENKTKQQLAAELKDLFEHGVDNPNIYQRINNKSNRKLMEEYLSLRKASAMTSKDVYIVGIKTSLADYKNSPSLIKKLLNKFNSQKGIFYKYGYNDIHIMGADEGSGQEVTMQLPAWRAINKIGGKVWVAGVIDDPTNKSGILNVLVANLGATPPTYEIKKLIQNYRKKDKVFIYSFPQGGVEDPYIYRRNYGFKVIEMNVDGIMTYAYMHAMNHPYNDFDHPTYKDLNFVYPTINGVIDTVQWEGYREAMDDIRYFRTLEKAIEKAKKDPSKKIAVAKGLKVIADIKSSVKNFTLQNSFIDEILDLSQLRLKIINAIIELKKR